MIWRARKESEKEKGQEKKQTKNWEENQCKVIWNSRVESLRRIGQ